MKLLYRAIYPSGYLAIYDIGLIQLSDSRYPHIDYASHPAIFDRPNYPLWRKVHGVPLRVIREAREVLKANLAVCN